VLENKKARGRYDSFMDKKVAPKKGSANGKQFNEKDFRADY
jgi:hypothetical protein